MSEPNTAPAAAPAPAASPAPGEAAPAPGAVTPPPPAPAAPEAPWKPSGASTYDRRLERVERMKAEAGRAAQTAPSSDSAPGTVAPSTEPTKEGEPAPGEARTDDAPGAEPPKDSATTEDPKKPEDGAPAKADDAVPEPIQRLRAKRRAEAERKRAERETRRVVEEARRIAEEKAALEAERKRITDEHQARLKELEPDLAFSKQVRELAKTGDVAGIFRAVVGKDASMQDALLKLAHALEEGEPAPAPAAAKPEATETPLTAEEAERIAREAFKKEQEAAEKTRRETAQATILEQAKTYVGTAEAMAREYAEKLPYISSSEDDAIMRHLKDYADQVGRIPVDDVAGALNYAEIRLAVAARPAEVKAVLQADPAKYRHSARLGISDDFAIGHAEKVLAAEGRIATAAEILKAAEDWYAAQMTELYPPVPPPPKPAPTVTGEWRQNPGKPAEPVSGATLEDRKAARIKLLREQEAARQAARSR